MFSTATTEVLTIYPCPCWVAEVQDHTVSGQHPPSGLGLGLFIRMREAALVLDPPRALFGPGY